MTTRACRACGAELKNGATLCPACGARQGPGISRVWILTFFVMGVVIGLLLLVLQQGLSPIWRSPGHALIAESVEQAAPRQPPRTPLTTRTPERPPGAREDTPAKTEQPQVEPLRCDREAALQVRERARTLASIIEQGGTVQLVLTPEWAYYSPGHRRSFVVAFSEADRCLQGNFRQLHFLFQGSEVATVSTSGAIQMK